MRLETTHVCYRPFIIMIYWGQKEALNGMKTCMLLCFHVNLNMKAQNMHVSR